MRSTIIVVGAIVAGIGLAWVAFAPSPEALPELPKAGIAAAPPTATEAPPRVDKPASEAFQARIHQPDAALAGMQGSVWSIVRRELSQKGTPESQALLAETNDLIRDLREARLRADTADFEALKRRQAELRAKIEGDAGTPVIDAQLKRLDELTTAYTSGGGLGAPMAAAAAGRPMAPNQGAGGTPPIPEGGGNSLLPPDFVPPEPIQPPEPEELDQIDPSSPLGIPWAEEGSFFGE
jgi:hypothetical protein